MKNFKEIEALEKQKKEQRKIEALKKFNKVKECSKCKSLMRYAFGEIFVCDFCGETEYTEFGKVRDFLELNGPKTATEISDGTGVPLSVINDFLREGRIEIPDGSDSYIKCEGCGADIRYGRFCSACAQKNSKSDTKAILNVGVGERPKYRKDMSGKMHTLRYEDKK